MAIVRTGHGATKTSATAATTSGAITVTVANAECIVVAVGTVGTTSNAPTDNATGSSNTYVQLGSAVTNTETITFWGVVASKSAVTAITCTFGSSRYAVAIDTYTGVIAFNQGNTTTAIGTSAAPSAAVPNALGSGNWALAAMTDKGTSAWAATTGNLRANVAGAGATTPGVAIMDNTTTTCTASISSAVWAVTIIELQSTISVNVSPTGSAITSAAGTLAPTGDANVSPTGNALTSAVGTVTIVTGITVNVTGNAITSSSGTLAVAGSANVFPTGVQLNSALGTVTIAGSAVVTPTGSVITSATGHVTITTSGGGGGVPLPGALELGGSRDIGTSSTAFMGGYSTDIPKLGGG